MQQTERKIFPMDQDYDYDHNPQVQTNPGLLSKFLFFNRLRMLYHYTSKISKQTLYRYNDGFEPMISTNKILNDFRKESKQGTPLSIASQIFKLEKRGIVTLIVLSIIAGLTSLVPIYFQFILVKAVMGNTGNYYSIAVIICVMFLRFILLNYVLNLSNNIALNAKIHMQNTLLRTVLASKALAATFKYFDVDLVGEALYYVPYIITSQIIVFGEIVFVFLQVGVYGCIVLGIYVVLYIFIAVCGKLAYEIMRENSERRTERYHLQKKSLSGLLRVALERVQDYVYHLLVAQKALQTKENLKTNILYILGQTFGEACIVLSNITLYALTDQQGVGHMFSYYSVLFMVACFIPMRYSVYGFFTIIKAYEAYQRIDLNFANIEVADLHSLPNSVNERHIFAQNVGDCFEYSYDEVPHRQNDQFESKLSSLQFLSQSGLREGDMSTLDFLRQGQVLMILNRMDSEPSRQQFLQKLMQSKPKDKSLIMINSAYFVLPISLKDNILFYSPYDAQKFKKVLQITQLNNLPEALWLQNRQLDDKNLNYNEWHQSRIQLARALYNDVDYLIINKQNLLDDLSLLTSVFAERRAKNKITIMTNNTHKYYFKLADRVLTLGKRGERQIGTYKELHLRRDSLFNLMLLRHHEKVDHSARILQQRQTLVGRLHFFNKQTRQSQLQKSTFFEFFSFVHRKAEIVILIAVILPPCLKYYMQYLIGTSVSVNILWKYLTFGLIYLFFIFMRGFVLSFYTNYSSQSLFSRICSKLNRLNAHQIFSFYQNSHVDLDFHSRIIDRNLVMDFQYAQSTLIENMVSFIVSSTGQPIHITVGIPMIVGMAFINSNYAKHARMIYLLKIKETKDLYKFIGSVVNHRLRIARCLKTQQFINQFHQRNKVEIIYNGNIQWLQTGVRNVGQLFGIIIFTLFLIIMVKTIQNQTLYTSLVSIGCSMFINNIYLSTFNLKTFRQMEILLVSLTLCLSFLKDSPHLTRRQLLRVLEPQRIKTIRFVQSIELNQVSLMSFPRNFNKISIKIQAGDRMVLSGNSNTFKEFLFYMLENKLFDCEEVKGDIIINGEIQRQFNIDGLYFLHFDPIIPFNGTVFQAINQEKYIELSQVKKQLQKFFEVMDLRPVFGVDTQIQTLTIAQKQLFEVFRVFVIKECKVLVIINGLDNIDIVTRRKLMKWLIKSKDINILIETTNVREMIELYPKRFVLQGDRIVQEEGQFIKEMYLRNLQKNKYSQAERQSETDRHEMQFDSMLRRQLKKLP